MCRPSGIFLLTAGHSSGGGFQSLLSHLSCCFLHGLSILCCTDAVDSDLSSPSGGIALCGGEDSAYTWKEMSLGSFYGSSWTTSSFHIFNMGIMISILKSL